ncbi:HNH endonuclease [Luteolibacter soli]
MAPSFQTDHIQPINAGGDKWDRANHQALCHSCHSKKTARFG